ncbi:hypothetical protein [Pelistega indica]|uniref:hypothetical protein n=1 Tax=Pelistega indica TaxID=1414851 RepID=UPI001FE18284|nr:hypothetical protein [Pelistega indica]
MKFLHSKRFLLIFALANIFVSTSVASQNNNTLSITDDRNVTVEVPAKPQRIAAISYLAVDVGLALGIKPVATTYMIPGRDPDFLGGLTKNIKKNRSTCQTKFRTSLRNKTRYYYCDKTLYRCKCRTITEDCSLCCIQYGTPKR